MPRISSRSNVLTLLKTRSCTSLTNSPGPKIGNALTRAVWQCLPFSSLPLLSMLPIPSISCSKMGSYLKPKRPSHLPQRSDSRAIPTSWHNCWGLHRRICSYRHHRAHSPQMHPWKNDHRHVIYCGTGHWDCWYLWFCEIPVWSWRLLHDCVLSLHGDSFRVLG